MLKRRRRFAYSGQRHNGEQVTGTIEQQTQSLARAELWHQGITAERVEPASRQRWQRRITAKDCRELTRQFSVLLQAELPLLQALDVLHRSLKHPRWSPIVHQIRHDVSQGQSLAYAFAQHPAYFDALFCNLIAAGEQSGALAPLCARVVAHQARTERLQQQVRDALRYPLIVLGIAGVLSAIMITQVVPTFADLFLGFADELPTLTQALLALSQGLQSMGWLGLSALSGSAVACLSLLRQRRFRPYWHRLSFALPILGRLQQQAAAAHLSQTLTLSLSAGVPLIAALRLAIQASQHPQWMAHQASIEAALAAGHPLHEALAQHAQLPELLLEMIQTGEQSGTLITLLGRAASLYDEQLELHIKAMTTWLEPMMMGVLAVLVGGLLLALYLPIFSMGSLL